jgi:NAD-dependent dihydropyrimidine dehydrogenase PreA subunit
MRKDALFIAVEVDDQAAADTALAKKLTEACPVDIYAQASNGTLELVEQNLDECVLCQNLDECVLCRLCLDASPDGAVKIIKLYDDGAILA